MPEYRKSKASYPSLLWIISKSTPEDWLKSEQVDPIGSTTRSFFFMIIMVNKVKEIIELHVRIYNSIILLYRKIYTTNEEILFLFQK